MRMPAQESNPRYLAGLLRARAEWPRTASATKQSNEIASPHARSPDFGKEHRSDFNRHFGRSRTVRFGSLAGILRLTMSALPPKADVCSAKSVCPRGQEWDIGSITRCARKEARRRLLGGEGRRPDRESPPRRVKN